MNEVDVGPLSALAEEGHFLTGRAPELPVIVIKGWDGVIRAFANVCRHRNIQIEEEASGRCESVLECPFHGWSYGFDGQNLSPGWGDGYHLHPLPWSERNGRVVVTVREADVDLLGPIY